MATLTSELPEVTREATALEAAIATPRRWLAWLTPLLLAAVTAAVTARQIHVGGFRSADEARHGMNGVFLLDMVRDGGWRHPRQYGERYYARYPALSIPYNHPPLFHLCEAVVFAALGASAATARLSVLLFHVAGVCLFYEIVRMQAGRWTGAMAAVLFATTPVVLLYSQRVYLEAPLVFFTLLATWCLLRYGRQPTRTWAAGWVLAVLAALLTKQSAAVILPAHLAYLAWRFSGGLWKLPGVKSLLLLAMVGLCGLAWLTARHSTYQMRTVTGGDVWGRLSARHMLRYPRFLPRDIGWPHMAAAAVGAAVAFAPRRKAAPEAVLFAAWAVSFWAMTVALNDRGNQRYLYLWTPAWAYFAGLGLAAAQRQAGPGIVGLAALGAFFIPVAVRASETNPPIYDGMQAAAQEVSRHPGGASVLVDAEWDGDFVFYMRQYDPARRYVLRGSKVLYTFASYKNIGFRSFAETDEEILDLLRRYGVHYVVVENVDEQATVAGSRLRQLLRTGPFERTAHLPLVDTQGSLRSTHLDVYYFREAPAPTADKLELHFPGLNQAISPPLEAGPPWHSPP